MDARQFGGEYMKAAEAEAVTNARIIAVTEGTDYDGNKALVLALSNDKKLQLKVGHVNQMIGLFGSETNAWVNQAITLTVGDGEYNGKPYKKFDITKYIGQAQAAAPAAPATNAEVAPPPSPNFDSELGF